MSYNKNNALIKVSNNSLKEIGKRAVPKITDGVKRIGKIAGWGTLGLLGFGTMAIGSTPLILIGGTVAIGSFTRAGMNVLYKTEPSLMFVSKKKNGERRIFQDTRLSLASKMKNYNAIEKAGMMGLQTLVGFSRWKENLKGADYEEGKNGEKIYCEKISTVTHGINLKTLKMIEDLGYIKIDAMEEKFKKNILDSILNREPRGLQTLLIAEKIGFKNYDDIKKIARAILRRDKKTLEGMKKTFQKVTFRLTDKEIDFEELYEKSANIAGLKDKKEQIALRRLSAIFDNKQGILSTKNIDIGKDNFGRDVIKYNTKETFGNRMARKRSMEQNYEALKFRNSLTQNVNRQGIEQRAQEAVKQKQVTNQKEENQK